MPIDLSVLYPLYSIDPRAVWKGQLALLLTVGAAATVTLIPLDPQSRGLRWLRRCGVAGIAVMVALQFAVLIRYLFYPSYLNHAEAITAAVSWLSWKGYPLYPRLDVGDVYGLQYGPILFQVTGFFLWLFGPSIGASKILGLTAFALSQVLSFVTLRRSGAGVGEALTMAGCAMSRARRLHRSGLRVRGAIGCPPVSCRAGRRPRRHVSAHNSDGWRTWSPRRYLRQFQDSWRRLYSAGLGVLSGSITAGRGGRAAGVRRRVGGRFRLGCSL